MRNTYYNYYILVLIRLYISSYIYIYIYIISIPKHPQVNRLKKLYKQTNKNNVIIFVIQLLTYKIDMQENQIVN